jgi:hypothetical protein
MGVDKRPPAAPDREPSDGAELARRHYGPGRPSFRVAAAAVASSPVTPITALVTAIGVAIGAWQSYQSGQVRDKTSYETLARASSSNTAAIEACRQAQADLRTWVGELSERLEKRQRATEQAIPRKPKAPPPEPAPPAPLAPAPPAAAPLPPFDAL